MLRHGKTCQNQPKGDEFVHAKRFSEQQRPQKNRKDRNQISDKGRKAGPRTFDKVITQEKGKAGW